MTFGLLGFKTSFLFGHISFAVVSSWTCWIVFFGMLILFILQWRKDEQSESPLQKRAARRFEYTHKEIFPLLSKKERKEMLIVLENTISNAELFKKKKLLAKLYDSNNSTPRRLSRENNKKVCFRL